MIPLGKGYYEFQFSSAEDLRCAWAVGTWSLSPGVLRLSKWSLDFSPNNQKQTHVQTWIRIVDLPMEHWRPNILFEIAGGIGTPLSLDESTKNKVFGHYARILVDVDLCSNLPNEIMVERNDYAFYVGIVYEKLPMFCDFCNSIGHHVDQCKKRGNQERSNYKTPDDKEKKDSDQVPEGNAHTLAGKTVSSKAYVPKNVAEERAVQDLNAKVVNIEERIVQNSINLDGERTVQAFDGNLVDEGHGNIGKSPLLLQKIQFRIQVLNQWNMFCKNLLIWKSRSF